MELDTLTQDRFEKKTRTILARCRASGNPQIIFKDGMVHTNHYVKWLLYNKFITCKGFVCLYYTWIINVLQKYYFLLGNIATGRQKLEEAAKLGQVDARYVLGMLVMAQGPHRKEEALALLNGIEEFRNSWRTRTLERTLRRVNHELFFRQIPGPEINDCGLTCTTHRQIDRDLLRRAFDARYRWIFECLVCLWDHCFARFANHFASQCDWLFD